MSSTSTYVKGIALAAILALAMPAVAPAHKGSPNYRSTVRKIEPSVPGLTAQVLNFDDRLELVNRSGGTHHGYFLPLEGASDVAVALFSFPSLAEYERYRERFGVDPEFVEADRIRDESGCVKRYERTINGRDDAGRRNANSNNLGI